MKYSKDEFGKDVLLKDDSLQVMMEWEKPYMEACIDALQPHGDILEIGFGLGYSATHIQSYNPKSHTIIECDTEVIKKAREWASDYKNINIIEGTWQEKLSGLGTFNAIFFDDYSPISSQKAKSIASQSQELRDQLNQSQETYNMLSQQLEMFKNIKFSDKDLEDFSKHLEDRSDFSTADVMNFIDGLNERGNITNEQKESFLAKFSERKGIVLTPKNAAQEIIDSEGLSNEDRLMKFYDLCLANHMSAGAKISSYIDIQEFEEKKKTFEENVIAKHKVQYTEKMIEVEVPKNCTYYSGDQALVMVVEKK